jgi:hypothetical protein
MAAERTRDDFPAKIKRALAYRVSLQCSNPLCKAPTAAAHSAPDEFNCIGEAAHITAASPGGPRYDPTLSQVERCSASNGIWLCRSCARIIDTDEGRFPPSLLRCWKQAAEASLLAALRLAPENQVVQSDFTIETPFDLRREVNVRFGFSFLVPERWNRWDPQNGDGAKFAHPDDEQIEIRGWGGYGILHDDLESSVEWYMEVLRKDGYFELISLSDVTRSVCNIVESGEDKELVQQAVKAARMVYRSGKYSYLHVKTRVSGTEFDVRCQAPSGGYAEFRPLFVHSTQSLRILGMTMAAHAKNAPTREELAR